MTWDLKMRAGTDSQTWAHNALKHPSTAPNRGGCSRLSHWWPQRPESTDTPPQHEDTQVFCTRQVQHHVCSRLKRKKRRKKTRFNNQFVQQFRFSSTGNTSGVWVQQAHFCTCQNDQSVPRSTVLMTIVSTQCFSKVRSRNPQGSWSWAPWGPQQKQLLASKSV